MPVEIRRSKRTYLGTDSQGRSRWAIDASLAPLQFREDGKDWEDIDTTVLDCRVTKCWYDLVIDPDNPAVTVTDKQTGDTVSLKLKGVPPGLIKKVIPTTQGNRIKWEDISTDLDLEVIAQRQRVVFKRILKSNRAPHRAEFEIARSTANPSLILRNRAWDGHGKPLEVRIREEAGILTEELASPVDLEYPVEIDPTLDEWVYGPLDDDAAARQGSAAPWWKNTETYVMAGFSDSILYARGSGMRFTGVTIPSGAIIDVAYLTLVCNIARGITTVRSDLCCENAYSPSEISDYSDHVGRTRTAAVPWDGIGTWTQGEPYQSPSIVSPVQAVVDAQGGTSFALMVFWEDKNDESDHTDGCVRSAASYEHATYNPPGTHIEYTLPGWSGKISGVTDPAKVMGVDKANIAKVKGVA